MPDEHLSKKVERMVQAKGLDVSPERIADAVRRVMASIEGEPVKTVNNTSNVIGKLDARKDYPLGNKRTDLVKSASGLSLDEITLEKVKTGEISFDDMRIHPETLEYQAQIAESAGRMRLATNLRRAAEMTKISDERVLEIYNALRPYRSTKKELLDIADELESNYQAHICAALIREAGEVYERRGRLKK